MKYTILGSGFIGTNLKMYLQNQSIDCFLPQRDYSFVKNQNLGHVIYAIGLTADFRTRPMETVKAHVCKLIEVLENSSFESFLYLSSTRVYNGSKSGDELTLLNVNPADFSDLYNISKLMGEAVCLAVPNEKIRIVRLSNVIGNDFNSDNFLFSLIKDAVSKGEIKLGLPADSAKDYIVIDDVVSLIQLISMKGVKRMYNVASGQPLSNKQLADEIRKYTNCKVEFPKIVNALNFPVIQTERIKEEFLYSPRHILPEIKLLIEKFKKTKHDSN